MVFDLILFTTVLSYYENSPRERGGQLIMYKNVIMFYVLKLSLFVHNIICFVTF